MGYGNGLKQAYDLRDAFAAEALAMLTDAQPASPLLPDQRARRAVAASSLAKAWDAACDRIRISRGKPLPGSRRPAQSKPRQPRRQSGLAQPPKPALPDDQAGQP